MSGFWDLLSSAGRAISNNSGLIGAGLNLGSGIYSASVARDAAQQQADAQREAARIQAEAANAATAQQQRASEQAIALQREQATAAQEQLRPYAEIGDYAAQELGGRLNNNALLAPFNPEDLYNDPGYQFQLSEGNKAIDNAAGARGSRYSGKTLKALTRFGQDYASNAYQNAYNRDAATKQQQYNMLAGPMNAGMGVSGTLTNSGANVAGNIGSYGTNAASNIGNIGTSTANLVGQYLGNAGDAGAEGQVAGTNALTAGAQNAYETWRIANGGAPRVIYTQGYPQSYVGQR